MALTAALAGGNLCHDVGYIEAGLTASMDMVVFADEAIAWTKRFMQGIDVSAETMALDVIDKVGPGGSFLQEDHTVRHVRENFFPKLLDHSDYMTWDAHGKPTLGDKTRKRVLSILETHRPAELPADVRAGMQAVLDRLEGR